jgi:hypothetical protein
MESSLKKSFDESDDSDDIEISFDGFEYDPKELIKISSTFLLDSSNQLIHRPVESIFKSALFPLLFSLNDTLFSSLGNFDKLKE